MKRVGFIGWRGMVGSVLMQRMREENDFALVEPTFFSTSQKGGKAPDIGQEAPPLKDANDIDELRSMDVLVSCQGGDYTGAIFPRLREAGWQGYWIDAASTLRMKDDAVIILDPVNMPVIEQALHDGIKNYIGGNCTVSLMLMAIAGTIPSRSVILRSLRRSAMARALGARDLRPHVETLANVADCHVSAHPNAGLPNAFGGYDEAPEETAAILREFAEAGLLNLVGGCCGTTPEHIAAIAEAVRGLAPRAVPALADAA